ncbi:phosphotransferase [Asanoa sp. NPDC050611]|uniref:phosphotransferase family protein n=1 Tax=Asanoa sp. NPDC050611 TaxID=3157098 RepID=UPI0033E6832B
MSDDHGAVRVTPPIRDWLTRVALPGRRVVGVRALTGGYSNDNLAVTTDAGTDFVLRRYRRTNACAVEAALAARLAGIVPVAEVVAADPTGSSAGEPVLLSRFMQGRPIGEVLRGAGDDATTELGRSVGLTLARLGSVSFESPGFFTDGTLEPGPAGVEPVSGLGEFVDRCLRQGNADGQLTDAEQRALRRFAEQAAPALTGLQGSRRLVHADFNPKNLLAATRDGQWRVTAVLDWEFAFSSSPLFDVGNMLRDPRPPGFAAAFTDGFRDGGGELPEDWRRLSQALDLYSLADLLTRPADHRYFRRSVTRIRALLRAD